MPQQSPIHGHVSPGFEAVSAAFEANFTQHGEIGASFCAWMNGEKIVDLWGGLADRATGTSWEADSLSTVFSSTKGLVATAMLMLADRGQLDYDAPVSGYWPEFGRHGKQDITVRQLLNHRSGLSAIDRPISLDQLEDREQVHDALVEQEPLWTPGTRQGYCAISYGLYTAELFYRITGQSLGQFIASEIAAPLEADIYLGLPEELETRMARLYPVSTADRLTKVLPRLLWGHQVETRLYRAVLRKNSTTHRAVSNPVELGPKGMAAFDTQRVHRLELPWANGIASARGLSKVYATLASRGTWGKVTLCKPETIAPLYQRQSWSDRDQVLLKPLGFSQGFIKEELSLFSPEIESFGHPGAGGALGFADPVRQLGFAYVPNRMDFHLRSPRCLRLCKALYESLGRRPHTDPLAPASRSA